MDSDSEEEAWRTVLASQDMKAPEPEPGPEAGPVCIICKTAGPFLLVCCVCAAGPVCGSTCLGIHRQRAHAEIPDGFVGCMPDGGVDGCSRMACRFPQRLRCPREVVAMCQWDGLPVCAMHGAICRFCGVFTCLLHENICGCVWQ